MQIVTRWALRRRGDLSSCQPEVVFFFFFDLRVALLHLALLLRVRQVALRKRRGRGEEEEEEGEKEWRTARSSFSCQSSAPGKGGGAISHHRGSACSSRVRADLHPVGASSIKQLLPNRAPRTCAPDRRMLEKRNERRRCHILIFLTCIFVYLTATCHFLNSPFHTFFVPRNISLPGNLT